MEIPQEKLYAMACQWIVEALDELFPALDDDQKATTLTAVADDLRKEKYGIAIAKAVGLGRQIHSRR